MVMVLVIAWVAKSGAEHRVRIDLEKETQKKVSVATTDFVFKG